ncbi:transforming growth factor-beta-induced protein ig-h3-like isoform X2 [Argiope bruennichi]|uniref:transforming growth factor-beta-induced protein ig-h3-like isoform X2 n=1 Tax=Argiope bruennichi TaxID=94029 RepID=UPI002494737C|nr:transforming growth factor-beta-induced protein ig-h3-like isoform X2 [Argiope bruennichi]
MRYPYARALANITMYMKSTFFNYIAVLFVAYATVTSAAVNSEPWWKKVAAKQGPMVCAEEHVTGSDRKFSIPWTGGSLCGSETIVRFSCCPGYGRTEGERGCPLVKPLKNLAETAQEIGASQFVKQADQSGILPLLTNRGAYTVFVARDDAFQSLTKEQEKALNGSKKSRSRPSVLLYTITEGRTTAEELPNSLSTLYREGAVSVTKYPSGLITVNCIPLVATNIEATNGIIHVTESLLLSSGRNAITDLLVKTPGLGTTATASKRAQLSNELRDKKALTFFAPTDEAWKSLPAPFLEALMEDSNSMKVLLQYHIVNTVWCSRVISGTTELETLEGSKLQLSCNETGQYVNEARILESDFTTRNGILHKIDSVLIPNRVRSLVEYLEIRSMTYFLKLLDVSGIYTLLTRQAPYTLFVPPDEAFEALSNETLSDILSQPSLARTIASFHVVSGKQLTSNAIDGQKLTPLQSQDQTLRLRIHKKRLTVEAALVTEPDLQLRNGIIHIIDKVLIPPTTSILDRLQEGNFSIFTGLLNQTNPNLLKLLGDSTKTFTIFAPSDDALNITMPPGMLQRLVLDPEMLYKTAARHILPVFVVSSTLELHFTYSYKAASDELITITKENSNAITVARLAEVVSGDILATNGVLHEISRMIQF